MNHQTYTPLRQHPLHPGTTCHVAGAVPQMVRADSPAIAVMTDLTQVSAATVGADATLAEATRLMIARGVRLLLVVDRFRVIEGVITAHDTMGERPINLLRDRGGRHHELHVSDLMTPRAQIQILDMPDVLRAEVGHIVATLKECALTFEIIHAVTGSSLGGNVLLNGSDSDYVHFIYFSLTSLTTVGFGDIYAVNTSARMLSTFLSTLGILFPAVVIARLVGLASKPS